MRPLFRTCLISLACSDILTTIFTFITYLSQLTEEFSAIWTLGRFLCSVNPFITTTAILVNSLTLVGIALDRYLSVTRVMKVTWEPKAIYCILLATVIWGSAAGISSPMITAYFLHDFFIMHTDPNNQSVVIDITFAQLCINDKVANRSYFSIIFFILFLPLLIAFLWLNAILAKEIWTRRHPIELKKDLISKSSQENSTTTNNKKPTTIETNTNSTSNKVGEPVVIDDSGTKTNSGLKDLQQQQSSKQQISSTKTQRELKSVQMFKVIIILMATFFLCRLPTWIYLLYKLYNVSESNLHWMLHFGFGLLSILNCILNPLLYTFLTETIKISVSMIDRIIYCKWVNKENSAV